MARSTGEVLDDWLVLAAQGGEASAFEALADRWHRKLLALAYRRIGESEGAAEAAQDAWLAIVRGLPALDDPARFPGWAARIVDRKAVDWLRRRRRRRELDDRVARDPGFRGDAVDPGPMPEPAGDARDPADAFDRLRVLLRELPGEQRSLLALFYTEGRPVREIAAILGIPEGTVKSRLFHARRLLKARLEGRP